MLRARPVVASLFPHGSLVNLLSAATLGIVFKNNFGSETNDITRVYSRSMQQMHAQQGEPRHWCCVQCNEKVNNDEDVYPPNLFLLPFRCCCYPHCIIALVVLPATFPLMVCHRVACEEAIFAPSPATVFIIVRNGVEDVVPVVVEES